MFAMFLQIPFPAFGHDGPTLRTGEKLFVGVVNDPPYLIKGKNGEWSGFSIDIWKAVATELQVSYELKEMKFSELLDALRENRIDLAIDGFFLLAEREKFMDFTVPLGSTRLAVAALPDRLDHPWLTALRIFFSWGIIKILFTILLVLCMLGFVLWIIERVHNPEHFGGGFMHGIGTGIYWVGSTLASGVCFGISLKSLTARALGLIWMLVCALMFSALTASLTSSLTMSKNMATTVGEETLRHLHLGGIKGSAESSVLKNLNGNYILYNTEPDALAALLHKNIDGYLYDEITLRYYSENDLKGKISVYPTDLRRFSFGYGLPKDSPWRTKIDAALLNLMEKPYWGFLLSRYGIGQNFEEIPSAPLNSRGR